MRKIKVSEATGAALDWLAAKCEGYTATVKPNDVVYVHPNGEWHHNGNWTPSTNWSQGGPIIERECITVRPVFHAGRTESGTDVYRQNGWAGHVEPKAFWVTPRPNPGPTPLIAAMRCYVASKLGDEAAVPEELLT